MKLLKSKTMKLYLARGIRKAKNISNGRNQYDGTFISLIYETLPNGWHYQVELVKDSRMSKVPWVTVYAYRPPKDQLARGADYYLSRKL